MDVDRTVSVSGIARSLLRATARTSCSLSFKRVSSVVTISFFDDSRSMKGGAGGGG